MIWNPATTACECSHPDLADPTFEENLEYAPDYAACQCPIPIATVLAVYQTSLTLVVGATYCACPRGSLTDPSSQQLLIYDPEFHLCQCPDTSPTNNLTQARQYYDETLQLCQCLAPAVNL